jgi:hypothetical protein
MLVIVGNPIVEAVNISGTNENNSLVRGRYRCAGIRKILRVYAIKLKILKRRQKHTKKKIYNCGNSETETNL